MKEIAPTADIGIVLPGKASLGITEDVYGKLENLKTGMNTVFVSDYARKISPAVLLRCKEEEINLVARDITSVSRCMPWIRIIGRHLPMQCEKHFSLPFLLPSGILRTKCKSNRKRNNHGKIYINENRGPSEARTV